MLHLLSISVSLILFLFAFAAPDFNNVKLAYAQKSLFQLTRAWVLLKMCSYPIVVNNAERVKKKKEKNKKEKKRKKKRKKKVTAQRSSCRPF
jgi:hypothetical protein